MEERSWLSFYFDVYRNQQQAQKRDAKCNLQLEKEAGEAA
jgi:hypothetical protein